MRFCGNFYFKLQYCGFTKPSGFAVFRNFRVIPKRFAKFLMFFCGGFIRIFVWFCGICAPFRPPLYGEFLA